MSWNRVRMPASSANLGPGLDALAVGLGLYLECGFRTSERVSIRASGEDAVSISTGADNLIWQTAVAVAAGAGREMPAIQLRIDNQIPIGKGLGSSAAARTAGVVIASQVLKLAWDRGRILDEAARLEGHPDNVAACVLGSMVAAAMGCDGKAHAIQLRWPDSIRIGLVIPDFVLPTPEARAVLPARYSREDAIYNLQRTALVVGALAANSVDIFREALEDRLHQPYRAALIPGFDDILRMRAPGLLGCVLSGAGPSVLVFHEHGSATVCERVRHIFMQHGYEAEVRFPEIAECGYDVESNSLG